MREVLAIAAAGAVGSLARFGLSRWVTALAGHGFPFGTMAANVLGCLLLVIVSQSLIKTGVLPETLRLPVTVGFFGALTTFSTFTNETVVLLGDGRTVHAGLNIFASFLLCLIAMLAGMGLVKFLSAA